ncbi:hypothetical protein GPALN_005904 [Globodera pallida]|nr:hypothetical protein GPALN_005904 [Globodera pallida]
MTSTIAAVLMTILALFAVCNGMFGRFKKGKEKNRSDATTNFHQNQTQTAENDESSESCYEIDKASYVAGVQQLTAQPDNIPTGNNSRSGSKMPRHSNFDNTSYPKHSDETKKKISESMTRYHHEQKQTAKNDGLVRSFYNIDAANFRHSVQHLTAEPAYTPKHISWSDSQMTGQPNVNMLNFGLNMLNPGSNMLNSGSNMLNSGSNMLNSGSNMLNPGSNMLNPGSNTNTQTSNYSTQNFSNTLNKRKSSSKKKASSSTTSHNFNQSQSVQFHPNQNQSSMQFYPNQNQSSMQFYPNQNQSSMQFHPIQDQSSMQFHPIQDQSSSWDNSDPNDGLLGSITNT